MRLMFAYGTPRIAAASFALTRFPVAMLIFTSFVPRLFGNIPLG
jgi:hypothetical protein